MSEKHTCIKPIPIHNPHRKIDDATCWVEGQRLLHQSHSETCRNQLIQSIVNSSRPMQTTGTFTYIAHICASCQFSLFEFQLICIDLLCC